MRPDYSALPENLQEGMKLYLEQGIDPGCFLTACLENDFVGALGVASSKTYDYLFRVASFLYNELPSRSYENSPWGSKENVQRWRKARQEKSS